MSEYGDDFDLGRGTLEEDLLEEGWDESDLEGLETDEDEFEIDHPSDED